MPKEYIPAVEAGVNEALLNGILAGCHLLWTSSVRLDGSYHEVDSSKLAFKIAASIGIKDGLQKGRLGA